MQRLLSGPVLPTLLRLAAPNVLVMLVQVLVAVAETVYIGRLGRTPLAAMALVFPFFMLAQQLSAGAMGGGVSSAVSRALGAGDRARGEALARHALAIGAGLGGLYALVMLVGGPVFYRLLGGQGAVLADAAAYGTVLFCGAPLVWVGNTLASVLRGSGDMRTPSIGILAASLLQIGLGALLGLGVGAWSGLGLAGVALAALAAQALLVTWLAAALASGRARLRLRLRGPRLQWAMFVDILRVGAVSMVSPLQSVLAVLIITGLVARLGPVPLAGYGIVQRLEFLLIPIAFGIGVAALPMVGMAIGAGQVARARQVAWTAGASSALLMGLIGATVALAPGAWAGAFTDDAAVLAQARTALQIIGPAFPMFGLGITLYFAAQGAGRVLGPVLAGTLRLGLVAGVGSLLAAQAPQAVPLFALVAAAMVAYGLASAAAVRFTRWG